MVNYFSLIRIIFASILHFLNKEYIVSIPVAYSTQNYIIKDIDIILKFLIFFQFKFFFIKFFLRVNFFELFHFSGFLEKSSGYKHLRPDNPGWE